MIVDQWEHVKELFEVLLSQAPRERKEFLERLSEQDAALAGEVARLLSSHEQAGGFLNQPCPISLEFFEEEAKTESTRFSSGDILCNRFRVVRLIGKGGMGEVYEAWDEEGEVPLALKMLRPEACFDEQFIIRFRKEFKFGLKISHPNVCRISGIFKHDLGNNTYVSVLSMEYLQGQTLAEYLRAKGGRLTVAEALPLVKQIIEGLCAVHAAGIIHRDLKPSNLILVPHNASYRLKITDFGIAGQLSTSQSDSSSAATRGPIGTVDYMAPEQLEHGRTSVCSDIYSLGLVVYEMVTGTRPFAGGAAWRRIYQDPPPVKKIATDLPRRWADSIQCCLERNPKSRFENVAQFLEAVAEGPSRAKFPAKPVLQRLRRSIRSKAWLIAVVLVSFVALSVSLFFYFNHFPGIPRGAKILLTEINNEDRLADQRFSGLTLVLKNQLEQSAQFGVAMGNDPKIVAALKQMQKTNAGSLADEFTARRAALRAGYPLVISGTLRRMGQHYVLQITIERVKLTPLFAAASWTRSFGAEETELLSVVHDAATWIRIIATEPDLELTRHNKTEPDINTASWAAWHDLTEANALIAQRNYKSAEQFLRSAIDEDQNFAMAHMRLADILISVGDEREGLAQWEQTYAAIREKQSRSGELTDRENLRIKGQYFEDSGDYINAANLYKQFTELYPDDYLGWFYWASVLASMNQQEDARKKFEKAIFLEPNATELHVHLAMLFLSMKNYYMAASEIEMVKTLGEPEWATWLEAQSAFLQSDFQGALKITDQLLGSSVWNWKSQGYLTQATFLAEMGQRHQAIEKLEKGIAIDSERIEKNKDETARPAQADKEIALAYLYYRQENFGECKRHAIEATRLDDGPRHLAEAGSLLARVGESTLALKILEKLRAQPDVPRVRFAKLRVKGEIELAAGNPEAITSLENAKNEARPIENQAYLASAKIEMHQDARSMLEKIADHPAEILLYRDHDFLGLWGDSLQEFAALDATCTSKNAYFHLRQNADPENNAADPSKLNKLRGLVCGPGN